MTDHQRITNLRTTSHILKSAIVSFINNISTFLLLSLLLFSFRSVVENGTHFLTSFIDRDPALKSLLSRLDLAGSHQHHRNPPRRRPFLHLTRVGTLDEDFFSGDDDTDRSVFNPNGKVVPNGSSVILDFDRKLGFSDLVADNGLKIQEIVRFGVQFKMDNLVNTNNYEVKEEDNNNHEEEEEEESNVDEKGGDFDRIVDFELFIKGLEIGKRDAAALFFLVSFLSAAYGWVILGFTAIYSWILGAVFVAVVNELLGKFISAVAVIWTGSKLGLKRLAGFILMRWAVRDALTQLIGLWYFGEIEDKYSFFKLFVRLKLMPFSIMSPWIRGFEKFEKEIYGFLFTWFLLDAVVAFIFAVDAWVTIVDTRRTGREIVREGCYLISTMFHQAVQLKSIESILCGSATRWLLTQVFGKFLAAVLQSTLEVYFMVAWLIFYFAARNKVAHSEGRRFGRVELEGLIDGLR